MSKTTTTNLGLAGLLIILSVYTIIGHHQSRALYLEAQKIQQQNQKNTAIYKQLLSTYSQKNDGLFIKNKAKKQLKMQTLSANNKRDIHLWKSCFLLK